MLTPPHNPPPVLVQGPCHQCASQGVFQFPDADSGNANGLVSLKGHSGREKLRSCPPI